MSRKTKFGLQPARIELAAQRWTLPAAAREIRVDISHFRLAVYGRVHPCPEIRTRLPKLLGRGLTNLFNEESLARPYAPEHKAVAK